MVQQLDRLKETASQTAGPYVHIGLAPNFIGIPGVYASDLGSAMVNDKTRGERITVTGRVFDGSGAPVKDAVIEIWQADAAGLFNSPSETRGKADPEFSGWGRQPVDIDNGTFAFHTIKPGPVPWPDGSMQAPHISLWIVARGINIGLHTRMYFSDEEEANGKDPLLLRIDSQSRANTLVAVRNGDTCTFDIRLQGDAETVFFDI